MSAMRCTSGVVKTARLAPPRSTPLPNRPMPDNVYSLTPSRPLIEIVWPTS
ncbi:MAG: hypothetical protein U0R24_11155 [Solirubrobacterales bacterium]